MVLAFVFIILLSVWIVFSGFFDFWHLGLGVVSCGLVIWLSRRFLPERCASRDLLLIPRFLLYIPWLLWQIVQANIYMAYLVLHPSMKKIIYPHIVRFKSRLKGDLGLTTFANSITLTPGTITVAIDGDVLYVHAIDEKVAQSLPGEMEEKVKNIFERE